MSESSNLLEAFFEKVRKTEIITSVKKSIDIYTFQPYIEFTGKLPLEVCLDGEPLLGEKETAMVIALELWSQLIDKANNDKAI